MALGGNSALAAVGHRYISQITGTGATSQFAQPFGVAVDGSGSVWVSDIAGGNTLVDKFDSTGNFLAQSDGTGVWNPSPFIQSLAWDSKANLLFVVDSNFDDLWGLNPDASYSGSDFNSGLGAGCCFISGAADNSGGPANGDLYVSTGSTVVRLDSTGNPANFTGGPNAGSNVLTGGDTPEGSFRSPAGVAVDALGNLYVADPPNGVIDEFDSTGAFVRQYTGAGVPGGAFGQVIGVAVDSSGNVYALDTRANAVDEFDSSGAFIAQLTGAGSPAGSFSGPEGIAVDANGDVYVADTGHAVVDEFGPSELVPDVTTGQASNVKQTTATLNGTVNPDGTTITSCQFDYVDSAEYHPTAPDPYSAGKTTACTQTPSGSNPVAVTGELSGLTPGTTYDFRLEAGNSNGTNIGSNQTFFAPGPPAGPAPVPGRSGLPDGRIYEQVSPVQKNGASAGVTSAGTVDAALTSADGGALFYGNNNGSTATDTFGTNQSGLQYFSVSSRSSAGWSTRGVLPAQSQQPDLTHVQFTNALPSQDVSELAIGSNPSLGMAPSNALDLISPAGSASSVSQPTISDPIVAGSPPQVAGASADLKQIYFAYSGTLLPSDDAPNPAFGGLSRHAAITSGTFAQQFNDYGFYEWSASGGLSYAGVLPDGSVDPYGALPVALDTAEGGQPNSTPIYFNNNEVSADGSRAFFVSPDPITGAPSSDPVELYVRERAADGSHKTVLVSGSAVTGKPAGDSPLPVPEPDRPCGYLTAPLRGLSTFGCPASYAHASADGSRVFFEDVDALTNDAPNDGSVKEYEFNTDTNTLTYLPRVDDQQPQPEKSCVSSPTICYLYSPIIAGTTDGSEFLFVKETTAGWAVDLWSAGQITPIAQFPEGPSAGGDGTVSYEIPEARFSSDGSSVAFETSSPIYTTAPEEFNNRGGFEQIYRYDASAHQLSCLSCGPVGLTHTGDANLSNDAQEGHVVADNHAISTDGGRVFFDSPDALVPRAVNGKRNVYEWEASGDGSCPGSTAGGCLFLISSGQSNSADFFLDNSANGNDVFFTTTQGVVPQDTDGAYDIYDARVGGGFPSPATAQCSGDACQGSPITPPPAPMAASVTFSGPGNTASHAPAGKPSVLTRAVHGATFMVRVRVPAGGRITVTGADVKHAARSLRGPGTYAVRVTLTTNARRLLARRHKLKLKLRVLYTTDGGVASAASVPVTVMPAAKRAPVASRSTRRSTRTTGRAGR